MHPLILLLASPLYVCVCFRRTRPPLPIPTRTHLCLHTDSRVHPPTAGEIIDQKQFLRSNVKYARVLMCVVPPQRNESIYGHHETRPTFRHNK